VKTFFQRPDQVLDCHGEREQLYVLTTVFNATRYRTRWKHYQDFAKHCETSGAILYTAEVAFGDREFSVTESDNPRHLQLRTDSELWLKENALNMLATRLPLDAKYIAWADSDIRWARHDWVNETIHQLQHFDIVQMWSEAEDLGPNYEGGKRHFSYIYSWINKLGALPAGYYGGSEPEVITWHPGFAWATKRHIWNALGGLIYWGILGSSDNHMANALLGRVEESMHEDIGPMYQALCCVWQDRALRYVKKNIGLVEGKLLHYHHGPKAARRYWDRWKILTENKFDPMTDTKLDIQGLMQLVVECERQQKLRDQSRAYFRQRNEDSPEV
jgi:hypothetical protein